MAILACFLGSTEGVPHRRLRHFNLSAAAPATARTRTRTTDSCNTYPRDSNSEEHKADCINNNLIISYSTGSTVVHYNKIRKFMSDGGHAATR
jgi:hypothetical protein